MLLTKNRVFDVVFWFHAKKHKLWHKDSFLRSVSWDFNWKYS